MKRGVLSPQPPRRPCQSDDLFAARRARAPSAYLQRSVRSPAWPCWRNASLTLTPTPQATSARADRRATRELCGSLREVRLGQSNAAAAITSTRYRGGTTHEFGPSNLTARPIHSSVPGMRTRLRNASHDPDVGAYRRSADQPHFPSQESLRPRPFGHGSAGPRRDRVCDITCRWKVRARRIGRIRRVPQAVGRCRRRRSKGSVE